MRTPGVGRELLVLLCGLGATGVLSACASPEASAEPGGPAEATLSEGAREPQQVVQRMVPVPARPAHSGDTRVAVDSVEVGSADVDSAEGEHRAAEPITSRHLEAELNRLEAELGR